MDSKELDRLKEISRLDLISAVPDSELQALVKQTAEEFNMPTAIVSVVLDDAQHFLASHGLAGWLDDARGTPREWAFCSVAVERRDAYVVSDAIANLRWKDNPLVSLDGIRAYAGVPLITSRGHAVGTLCVLGPKARFFTTKDVEHLRNLAAEVLKRLEARSDARSNLGR